MAPTKEILSISLDKETLKEIKTYADVRIMSLSGLVDRIIKAWLKKNKNKK